jgi:hypothetical protein
VISELVTNARKYAPGPVLMDLRSAGDAVEAVVWDCDPVLPLARAGDEGRMGQHEHRIRRRPPPRPANPQVSDSVRETVRGRKKKNKLSTRF